MSVVVRAPVHGKPRHKKSRCEYKKPLRRSLIQHIADLLRDHQTFGEYAVLGVVPRAESNTLLVEIADPVGTTTLLELKVRPF